MENGIFEDHDASHSKYFQNFKKWFFSLGGLRETLEREMVKISEMSTICKIKVKIRFFEKKHDGFHFLDLKVFLAQLGRLRETLKRKQANFANWQTGIFSKNQ